MKFSIKIIKKLIIAILNKYLKIKNNSKLNYLWYILSFIFSCIAIGCISFGIFAVVTRRVIIDWQKIKNFIFGTPPLVEPVSAADINYPPLMDRPPANAPLYNLN